MFGKNAKKQQRPFERCCCLLSFDFERSSLSTLLLHSRTLGVEEMAVAEDEEVAVNHQFLIFDI